MDDPSRDQSGAVGADSDLAQGLVFGGDSRARLAEAKIHGLTTAMGYRMVVTTHSGFGYKETNEDRIAVVESCDLAGSTLGLFVIDGMGGHHGGDLCAQALSEELVLAARITPDQLAEQSRDLLTEKILALVTRLPGRDLVGRVVAALDAQVGLDSLHIDVEEIHRAAIEIVQVESIQVDNPEPEVLQNIAEIVDHLMRLSLPDRTELAVRNTRRRIERLGYREKPPDACFVGAIIRSTDGMERTLDIKQVGDCKLVVRSRDGKIRFQTIGESVIGEPDLRSASLGLADLMTYSLHRNFVANSMNMIPLNTKRYRKSEVPLTLEPGDVVYLYSDGCDDLFMAEEVIAMEAGLEPEEFVRTLLQWSDRRMRFVSALLRSEQSKRDPADIRAAYPAAHRIMNEHRLNVGLFAEKYHDGTSGKWLKPPKCDNFAFVRIEIE